MLMLFSLYNSWIMFMRKSIMLRSINSSRSSRISSPMPSSVSMTTSLLESRMETCRL